MYRSFVLISYILVCFGLLAVAANQGSEDCVADDADPAELAEAGILSIDALSDEGITREEVMKQLEVIPSNMPNLREIIDANMKLADGGDLDEMTAEFSAISSVNSSVAQNNFFRPACPVRYYYIRRVNYFFSGSGRMYCFPYYPIRAVSCSRQYCYNNFRYGFFSPRTRCFRNNVRVWFHARCYFAGSRRWSSQYRVHSVPRSCSCRNFVSRYVGFMRNGQTCSST